LTGHFGAARHVVGICAAQSPVDTIEELRAALVEFATRYNETWLVVARHGYRTPAKVRADQCRIDQTALRTSPSARIQLLIGLAGILLHVPPCARICWPSNDLLVGWRSDTFKTFKTRMKGVLRVLKVSKSSHASPRGFAV
jgi:hypothetical protein